MLKFTRKIPLLAILGVVMISLASCTPDTTSTQPGWIDYVNDGSVSLKLDYEGHDFYTDGIGQVTVKYEKQCIDGDTVHFDPIVTTTSSERIKSRFYGVDTPESTGKIQPWGKQASDFTHEKVWNAVQNGTVVLSSPYNDYHTPEPDSTGERYVTLVWINETVKNAPKEDLILLNLMLVQEGYSTAKNVMDFPEMADTFTAAEAQAKAFQLHIHSSENPPGWNDGEYRVDVSLLDLKIEIEKTLEDPDYIPEYNNEKITFTGTVAGFANHILYLVQYFTEEEGARYPEGEYAGINIFVGMSDPPSKYRERNAFIQVSGTAVYSNFGFQITDTEGRFPNTISYSDSDAKVLLSPEENTDEDSLYTFEYTREELNDVVTSKNYESLNTAVKVTEPLVVQDVYIAANNEITVYFENCEFNAYVCFMYRGNPDKPNEYWYTEEQWIGKRMYIQGIYTYHDSVSGRRSWQINPTNNADFVWADAPTA